MPVSHAVTNQFEAELNEGDHKTLRLTDSDDGCVLQSHAGQSAASNSFLDDAEDFHSEDRLGCVRGVLWSLVFEAALVIAGALYWTLRVSR